MSTTSTKQAFIRRTIQYTQCNRCGHREHSPAPAAKVKYRLQPHSTNTNTFIAIIAGIICKKSTTKILPATQAHTKFDERNEQSYR
mmetsp:Transcript_20398/g.58535  ORF Transcript_20398/g.58535 Transcript_20398/m.58535 type:complete len:86 (-) Transcript_20398:1826-2083(-)